MRVATLNNVDGRATPLMRAAAAVVALETLVLLAVAVLGLVSLSTDRPALGVTNSVFFLLCATGLGLCAHGLAHYRAWSRGPIVIAQVIQLGIAWSFVGQKTAWLSVVLAVPAVAVLGAVLAPSTTTALYGRGSVDDG